VKFADLVVVLVEGARLDLGTLIARYEVYKLERQRYRWEASAQKQLSTALLGHEYETGERRVLERTRGCSRPLQLQGTVSSRRDGGGCVAVRDGERTCPRLGRGTFLKYSK